LSPTPESTATIGIVTLNMNQSQYLLEAVRSIQQQRFSNWRLIVVDPGSTDGAEHVYKLPSILEDSRIEVLIEPDQGPADGLNKGFGRLRTPYMYCLNADDRVIEGAFESAIARFSVADSPDVLIGHGYVIDLFGRRMRRIFSDDFHVDQYMNGNCVAVQQATFFRRSVLQIVGGFNVDNHISWDGEFLVRAALAGARISTVSRYWGRATTKEEAVAVLREMEAADARLTVGHTRWRDQMIRRGRHPLRTMYLLRLAFRRQLMSRSWHAGSSWVGKPK
jgi:glycosyltransferase involved in cell wall biosynthesis